MNALRHVDETIVMFPFGGKICMKISSKNTASDFGTPFGFAVRNSEGLETPVAPGWPRI
jgi:hypothetical protein